MIYKIIIDGNTDASVIDENILYYSGDSVYTLDDIELNLTLDDAGELRFVIYSNHPNFNLIKLGVSHVYMYRDTEMIFDGFISEIDRNIYNALTVYCTGILGVLNFSVQPQRKYQGTPDDYLMTLIDTHNGYSELVTNKPFLVYQGTLDVDDDYILRYSNYESTLECIRRDLMESYGIYPKITHDFSGTTGKWPILSLYPTATYGDVSNQVVEMGENILEYAEAETIDPLYTAVIPLGKRKEDSERVPGDIAELDAYIDIHSVNGSRLYLLNAENVAKYGFKCAVVKWEDVTIPKNLKAKAQNWLDSAQYEGLRLDLTAIDLAMLGNEYDAFRLGDRVRVKAAPLNIDITLPVFEMNIFPLAPDQNTLVLGADAPGLVGREIPEADVHTDADAYTLADWNTDFYIEGVQFDGFSDYTGPNYWNTGKATKEPVTLCNNYTYVYPAGADIVTTHDLAISIPPLLSQEDLTFDVAKIEFFAESTFPNTATVNVVSPQTSENVGRIFGNYVTEAYFRTNTGFGALLPMAGTKLQLETTTPSWRRREMTVKFNSITGVIQRNVFPWFVSGYDLNNVYQDGGSNVVTEDGTRWLTLTGKRSLRGTFVFPDQTSHPKNLSVRFSVKREVIADTTVNLVDHNGNTLSANGSDTLGWTYGTMTDADEVLTVKFGDVTHVLTAGDLDAAAQTITLDLTADTSNATEYLGHYIRQIIFYVNAPYRIYLTDIHINGEIKYWTDNPYHDLIAF